MALDVAVLKAHCNVTASSDDAVLTRLLAAATKHTERLLGFAIDDVDQYPEGTPDDVEQAVYMLAAHWYENREASIVGVPVQSIPFGYPDIIAEHRTYTFAAEEDDG